MKKFLSSMDSKKKSTLVKVLAASLVIVLVVVVYAIPKGSPAPKTDDSDTRKAAQEMEEQTGLPVVTVLMDLPESVEPGSDEFSKTFRDMPGYDKDFRVVVESMPLAYEGSNRDNTLTRVRTEIMAGKGPDLLICGQPLLQFKSRVDGGQTFFPFPEQVMESHLLLPLDDYIKDAEYMEWDSLVPEVMAAGRNEEGQQIMPLSYSFVASFFDKEYTPTAEFPMTWAEMARDPDPMLRYAASQVRMADVIGEVADYSKDAPAFSEEELLEWCEISRTMWDGGIRDTLPEEIQEEEPWLTLPLDQFMLEVGQEAYDLFREEYTIIPAYNLDGGVTANVLAFAAINRNVRHPDLAFKLIDYLMSPKVLQTSPLVQNRMQGMPVYATIGDENTPSSSAWRMTEGNYRQIKAAREQINVAKFTTPVDSSVNLVLIARDEDLMKKSAHTQYVEMKMYLGES